MNRAENNDLASGLRRFKRYPAYKESGVDWLGAIPAGWEVKRLRFVVALNPPASELQGVPADVEVSFVPMEAVGEYGGLDLSTTKLLADVGNGYTYFRNGDVVVAKITPCFENGKGTRAAGLTNGIAFGTTELHVLRATSSLDDQYLFYLTLGDAFRRLGEAEMYGAGGQKRVPASFIENLRHPLPPVPEQRAIATFLDRDTARIDALTAQKERLIELLQEKRAALITRVVTKGLDPNVPMKDSGVEWLGEIPAHWEVKRLKYLGDAIIGLTYEPEDVVGPDDGVLLLRASNVDDRRIALEDNVFISCTIPEHLKTRLGDILICSRSGSRALIGKCARIDATSAGLTFGTFMTIFRSPRNAYLFYVLNSRIFDYQSGLFLTSTINQLTVNSLKDLTVPVPPEYEQTAIAASLDHETAKLDALITKVLKAVNDLKNLRTALISAAVTGKIDVREEVA